MLELRDYQVSSVNAGLNHLLNGRAKDIPMIISPTAGGKSLICAKIAHTLEHGVLVLQPSVELLKQNYAKFLTYGGEASLYSASVGEKEVGAVTFATIQSLKDKAHLFGNVRYVIIDECHLVPPSKDVFDKQGRLKKAGSMFTRFLMDLPDGVMVIGMTATAFRLKKYRDPFTGEAYSKINLLPYERPHFFNKFLYVTQIRELYDKGFLCPIRYVSLNWDGKALKVNTTGADYSEESVKEQLEVQEINKRLPDIIAQAITKGRKHILVFVNSVEDASELTKRVPNSASVSAYTKDKEREQIIEDFKSGKITTVFNVSVLTTGFDFPAIDTVILARPTMSLALYMQMVGRGIRIFLGKEYCVLVDMCGNIDRFGHIEDIEYRQDPNMRWYIASGEKVLSGVPIK
jgi:DNA repair protein RadD